MAHYTKVLLFSHKSKKKKKYYVIYYTTEINKMIADTIFGKVDNFIKTKIINDFMKIIIKVLMK